MLGYGLPALYALVIWWASTGLVLYVVGMPRSTHATSMAIATGLAAFAGMALWATSDDTSLTGAFAAFTGGLVLWGWHEMSFLTGFVTGPRKGECPGRAGDVKPVRAPLRPAIEAVIYHEIAIALTAFGIAALVWGGANQIGLWTFVILWLMRLSAKLNVYFGVLNLTEQFLPDHLKYLKSYFCRRPMNLFFPLSVTTSSIVTVLLAVAAANSATDFAAAGWTFLAVFMALAVLEHWFLVVPIPAERLWSWGLASRKEAPGNGALDEAAIRAAAA